MFRDLQLRLRSLFRRSSVEREMDEELRFHADHLTEMYEREGLDPSAAARRARLELGGLDQTKEECRDALGVRMIDTLLFDLRLAVKRLRKDARVSVAVILTLALGIGASTVAIGLFDSLVRSPFPYAGADRLITFAIRNVTSNGASVGRSFFSSPELRAFRQQSKLIDDFVGTSTNGRRVVVEMDGQNRLVPDGAYVTANAFDFYGVAPVLGRGMAPQDGDPGASPVFVVGKRVWQDVFASDPAAIGRTYIVNAVPRTLIGVMPPRFQPGNAHVWIPMDETTGSFGIIARLKPGVTVDAAALELDTIAHRLTQSEPGFVLNPDRYKVVVTPLADAAIGGFKTAVYALLGASFLLLLIACANVANLLLARATGREREITLCAALGATRARLFGQLLAEGGVLSLVGGSLGCACAWAGLQIMAVIVPRNVIPGEAVVALRPFAMLAAVALSVTTAIVCALAPALHVLKPHRTLRVDSSARGERGSVSRRRLRSVLIVAEVALSMVLLAGATLTLHSFFVLTHEPLPFDPSATLYATVVLPHDTYYVQPDRKPALFDTVLARIKAMPGVVSVSESLMLPPDEGSWTDIAIPGRPHVERWTTDMELCTEGYFRTLAIPLVRGRLLSADDVQTKRYVVVVNQSLARSYFGTDDPIGQRIKFEVLDRPFIDAPHNTYFEVVGVVADFRTRPGHERYLLRPTAYLPASVAAFGQPLQILASTSIDPHSLVAAVSKTVLSVEPKAIVAASGSIADVLGEEFRAPRFEFFTLGVFGGVGLVLAAIGVFSVMAYAVSLERYEIGVRLALGASASSVLRILMMRGVVLVMLGAGLGLVGGRVLSRVLDSLLWGISSLDPWAFVGAAGVMLLAGSVACLLPARRAARVDPVIVLRAE